MNGTRSYIRNPSTARLAITISVAEKHSSTTDKVAGPTKHFQNTLWMLRWVNDVMRLYSSALVGAFVICGEAFW
jgi:hypothetical protein